MKIVHVVPTLNKKADGVADVVRNICEIMTTSGQDVRIATLDWAPISSPPDNLNDFPIGLGPRRLGRSPKMFHWLKAQVSSGEVELIHNHSLWMFPNVYAGLACTNSHTRLIVSPHGTLSLWALSRNSILKKIFWRIYQRSAICDASCFHATSESEYEDIRRLGFNQPVSVISCGVNIKPLVQNKNGERKRLLFLGRIHQVKGVDNLLKAWFRIESKFPDWDLYVVGPDNGGYLAEMQSLSKKLKLRHVVFCGPLFGNEKLQAYRDANLYVLPTYSENFGITVAEALAAGIPAIVTKGAPWAGLTANGAGWWIDVGVEPLVACLEQALATPQERLQEMGRAGHEWMARDFSWESVSEKFLDTYRWVINGGKPPPYIRLN